ncbi:MAG: hypothetical protein AAFN08_09665 [Cyanobacteria bacterium J06559_3]
MIRQPIRSLLACFAGLLVLIGMTGCSSLAAAPPQAVVAQAVAVQAEAYQTDLWQQLSLQTDATPSLSINRVKVRQTRPVQVASTLAYEVTGTYQYKLRYPNRRRLQQSQVPFTVVLQAIPDTEDWQLLRIESDRAWVWEPLSREVEG